MIRRLLTAKVLVLSLAVIAISAALVYLGFFSVPRPPAFTLGAAGSLEAQGSYWQSRIRTVGGPAAYTEFLHWIESRDPLEEHTLAHAFGGALYATVGESGLTVCDGRASYGCFHELMGKAIADHGLSEVDSLVAECQQSLVTSPLSCMHGIGHGVAAYFGYLPPALNKALAVCTKESVKDPIDSCYSGVFMEYNMRTMLGATATTRPSDDDLLAPCDMLSSIYQRSCAYQQPQWWIQALYQQVTPNAAMYARLGALCDQMERDPVALRACYEGLGTVTPVAVGYDPEQSAALCAASSASKLHQLFCVSYAASAITDGKGQAEGLKVCTAPKGAELHYCAAYATKQATILYPLPAPDVL